MATMKRAKKIRIEDKNRQLIKVTPAVIGIIQNLELLTKPKTEPKKGDGSKKRCIVQFYWESFICIYITFLLISADKDKKASSRKTQSNKNSMSASRADFLSLPAPSIDPTAFAAGDGIVGDADNLAHFRYVHCL